MYGFQYSNLNVLTRYEIFKHHNRFYSIKYHISDRNKMIKIKKPQILDLNLE